MSEKSPRDYGMGMPDVRGAPRVAEILKSGADGYACPNCGCETIAKIEIDVVDARLHGGHGTGRYVGCPACPWASPMVTMAAGPAKGDA
jgi:hypothetical protein